jgi:regulator of sigma D
MFNLLGKIFGGKQQGEGIAKGVADIVDRFVDTKEDKREFFKELYKLEADEKANARAMYGSDSSMQKVYAITFLIAYLALTAWLIYAIINGSIQQVNQFETGLIGSIWGAMTSKINTITDFFFGASENKEADKLYKKK